MELVGRDAGGTVLRVRIADGLIEAVEPLGGEPSSATHTGAAGGIPRGPRAAVAAAGPGGPAGERLLTGHTTEQDRPHGDFADLETNNPTRTVNLLGPAGSADLHCGRFDCLKPVVHCVHVELLGQVHDGVDRVLPLDGTNAFL